MGLRLVVVVRARARAGAVVAPDDASVSRERRPFAGENYLLTLRDDSELLNDLEPTRRFGFFLGARNPFVLPLRSPHGARRADGRRLLSAADEAIARRLATITTDERDEIMVAHESAAAAQEFAPDARRVPRAFRHNARKVAPPTAAESRLSATLVGLPSTDDARLRYLVAEEKARVTSVRAKRERPWAYEKWTTGRAWTPPPPPPPPRPSQSPSPRRMSSRSPSPLRRAIAPPEAPPPLPDAVARVDA